MAKNRKRPTGAEFILSQKIERDTFHGVGFRHYRWTAHRMAPTGAIGRITKRWISLRLSMAEIERCPAYQEEQVYRIGSTGFFRHREGWRKTISTD